MPKPVVSTKPDFHDRFTEYENLDSNLDRPVHGLDLLSVISDPNVTIDTARLLPLGQQTTGIPINSVLPLPAVQDFNWQPPELGLPTPTEIEAAAAGLEEILCGCFRNIDRSVTRGVINNFMNSLDKMNENQASLPWQESRGSQSDSVSRSPEVDHSQFIKLETVSVSDES